MRIFSLIVAFLAFLGGIGCVSIASKLERMYEDLGVPLPGLTVLFVKTSGWFPGGIFLALAVLVLIVVAAGKPKASLFLSVPTLVMLIVGAIVMPVALMAPFSKAVQDVGVASAADQALQEPADSSSSSLP